MSDVGADDASDDAAGQPEEDRAEDRSIAPRGVEAETLDALGVGRVFGRRSMRDAVQGFVRDPPSGLVCVIEDRFDDERVLARTEGVGDSACRIAGMMWIAPLMRRLAAIFTACSR